MTYIDIPYIYLQQNVESGAQAPPADLIQQLVKSVKIQYAAVVLLSSTVFAASSDSSSLEFTALPVITIPVALLWRVRIDVRRKVALGTTVCLSVFTVVCSIVRVSGGNTVNGQIDSSWVILWLQIEAAVAVMMVSTTAFRALFVAERSQKQESPRYAGKFLTKYWYGTKESGKLSPNKIVRTHYEEGSLRSNQQLHRGRDPSQVHS
ncbi:MAG: hypothetical protein LQ338_008272 [Usnochroma carphineum]|nr:MAG: hypothetical protein LQ338_008272 [Usnochroma carphineum]